MKQKENPGAGDTARGVDERPSNQRNPSAASPPPQGKPKPGALKRPRAHARLMRMLDGRARLVVSSDDPSAPAIVVSIDDGGPS